MTIATRLRPTATCRWTPHARETYRVAIGYFKASLPLARKIRQHSVGLARLADSQCVLPIHVSQAVYAVMGRYAMSGYGRALAMSMESI